MRFSAVPSSVQLTGLKDFQNPDNEKSRNLTRSCSQVSNTSDGKDHVTNRPFSDKHSF